MRNTTWVSRLDDPFYREFDHQLEQASIPSEKLHLVLDRLGAPPGNGVRRSVGERVKALALQQERAARRRARIGCNYSKQPRWKMLAAIPLIYLPILVAVVPLAITVLLVRAHLRLAGGHDLKSYWADFVPTWISHRYTRRTQIIPKGVFDRFGALAFFARSRVFWIFNCKLYCPLSVALLAYLLYLVKIVEQWWCPFGHDRKPTYADAPIDASFWHASGDAGLLHPPDRHNPGWSDVPGCE